MSSKFSKKILSVKAALLAGTVFFVAGVSLAGYNLYHTWDSQRPVTGSVVHALTNTPVADNGNQRISGTPTHISIPSVGIDLNIIPGYYYPANQSWTLSLNNAQYATMTAPANNKEGDTFIYAHNRKGVFYTLPKIEPGATAEVTTDNGHVFTYVFSSSLVTSPEDTSLFSYKGKPILVLQTCTGLWYQNRQLFTFNLAKVDQQNVVNS